MAAVTGVSERRVCRVLSVPRSRLSEREVTSSRRTPRRVEDNPVLVNRIGELVVKYPTFGYRRLWAMVRMRDGILVNRKVVYRIVKEQGWFVHQRTATPRPRVQGLRSRADKIDERWAMDVTHVFCGQDGWAHLAAVIDCHSWPISVTQCM